MEDSTIIIGCQNGERIAQRLLFDRYYNYVYTISYRYLNNHHNCEDVTSISFNRIFKNIEKVTNTADGGLKKWIQTIAINEALRFLKKKSPIVYTEDEGILDQVENVTKIASSWDMTFMKKLVNEMPEGYRRIFLLKTADGLTHDEIAEHLSISRNTSKSQMLKARKYLQTKLKNYESQKI